MITTEKNKSPRAREIGGQPRYKQEEDNHHDEKTDNHQEEEMKITPNKSKTKRTRTNTSTRREVPLEIYPLHIVDSFGWLRLR